MSWRNRLLLGVALVYVAGEGWMLLAASPALRGSIALLTAVYVAAMVGAFVHYRKRIGPRLLTANLGLGAIVHLALTALIVAADRLTQLGVLPALATNWWQFLLGALGIVAAFLSWTRARRSPEEPSPPPLRLDEAEPPPIPSAELDGPLDWDALDAHLAERGDGRRRRELARLHHLADVLAGPGSDIERLRAARRVVHQEARRLRTDADADARDEDDVVSQAAALLEWGAQKLPELAELDVSDLLMAKAVADIRTQRDRIERRFVDHRQLLAIHPIDRATADARCDERARAARDALPLLRANGMRLSEELIAAEELLEPFRSVTGFQVVSLSGGGFVTFEGNGRREALQRAFGDDEPVFIEVRHFVFDDPRTAATIERRVQRVRRRKGVSDAPAS